MDITLKKTKKQEDVLFSFSVEETVCSHFPLKHEFDLP